MLETKQNLKEETIAHLKSLIRINLDSVEGFRHASEHVDETQVASLFRELREQRENFASELKSFVEFNDGEAPESGTIMAVVHRIWLDLRAKLNGGDAHVVLCEAERGEDYIKKDYEDALTATAGSAMNDVLTQQYAVVKRGHDRVRDLRDSYQQK